MLERIYADNYRCFVNFEFRPQQVNLLLGANGTGKSTVFGVLIALQDLLAGAGTNEVFPTSNLTAWGGERTSQRFELDIVGAPGRYRYELVIEHDRERQEAHLQSERLLCEDTLLYASQDSTIELYSDEGVRESAFPAAVDGSFLALLEPRPNQGKLSWFKGYMERMLVLRLEVRQIGSESQREAGQLDRTGGNFAAWYRNVLQERVEVVPVLTEALRDLLPGLKGLKLAGPAGRRRQLVADFGYELPLDELSDGQILLIVLYTLLHTALREERLVCLDEPDNYVALREIQPWLRSLQEAVREAGGQVLIVSHHPEAIDYLAADHAWEFVRHQGGPARVRPFEVDRDTGLSASRWLIERGE